MHHQELKQAISRGLLSFPLTDFDDELRFAPRPYAARLEWLMPFGATALFAAGGTGEFFSLEPEEFSQVVQTAIQTCKRRMPIIAAAGGGTTLAIKYAQEAGALGAQGVLLMPHYLTEATQSGLIEHVAAVCKSVQLGVIVYNRGASRLKVESLLQLADRCPNLIGFKDGIGDIERFVSIRRRLGDRFSYLGGLPTAEVFAGAYLAMGCPVSRQLSSISFPGRQWSSTTRTPPVILTRPIDCLTSSSFPTLSFAIAGKVTRSAS
jgi:5-dehydro-4-deoxyglucarate dehydratase